MKKDKKNVVKPFEKWQVFQRASRFIEKKERKKHTLKYVYCADATTRLIWNKIAIVC